MANTTLTKAPEDVKSYTWPYGWDNYWQKYDGYDLIGSNDYKCYRVSAQNGVPINTLSLTATFSAISSRITNYTVGCSIYTTDPTIYTAGPIVTKTIEKDPSGAITHTFQFPNLNIKTDYIYLTLSAEAYEGETFDLNSLISANNISIGITVDAPALQVTVSPSSVYVGEDVTISFNDTRLSQSIKIQPYYGSSTPIGSEFTVTSDSYTLKGVESWFDQAAVSGDTMRVTLHATDALGRTNNSASFDLKRYAALTPTIVNPSGTKNAGGEIPFSWTVSGDGTQTKAVLEWSTDQITWKSLKTITGSAQTWTAPAATFTYPGGLTYWRVKLTNSYGRESAWVQGSFTAQYSPATVTLNSPTSGSRDGAGEIQFIWTITSGSGRVNGMQFEYSTDGGGTWTQVFSVDYALPGFISDVAYFPAGTVQWRVRASDSYTGYVENWATASFTVTYDAISQVIPVNSPTSGIYSASADRTFTVALQASGPVHTPFTIASAKMYWRSGESGTFTSITMTPNGNQASTTIAGGTFPSGIIQWYAEATDNTGRQTTTETYTIQALNAAVEAAPLSPINTLESGSGPIVFTWSYGSIDGSAQSRAQIRYSSDNGEHWTILPTISGNVTQTIVPAGTFPGGTIVWQVRSYNSAGTEGPWSRPVSFISFAAPIVDGVTGDGKPFLTVMWQVEGQQAYEIAVNGKRYGPYYGEVIRSYTIPDMLPDGNYAVRVRVQNKYGLWSEWAEGNVGVTNNISGKFQLVAVMPPDGHVVTLSWDNLTVLNPPIKITQSPRSYQATSGSVTFAVSFQSTAYGIVKWQRQVKTPGSAEFTSFGNVSTTSPGATRAQFSITAVEAMDGNQYRFHLWNDACDVYSDPATFRYLSPNTVVGAPNNREIYPETGYFIVYRDGTPISKTFGRVFTDRTAIGQPSYYVIQVYKTGNYQRSADATAPKELTIECPLIAPLDGGDFIQLGLSDNFEQNVTITRATHVERPFYSGAKYPAVEIGEQEELSASFDTFWIYGDDENADALEAMRGQSVLLKFPFGLVLAGVLDSLPGVNSAWRRIYTIKLSQMEWRDFVDDT